MPIIVNLDVMMAKEKYPPANWLKRSASVQPISPSLKPARLKLFVSRPWRRSAKHWIVSPEIFSNINRTKSKEGSLMDGFR